MDEFAVEEPGYDSGDEAIYLAFQDVKFVAKKMKKGKKTKNTINKYITLREGRPEVQELLSRYKHEEIQRKMTRLVREGVFTNRSTAMRVFPNLSNAIYTSSAELTSSSKEMAGITEPQTANPDGWTLEPESARPVPAARNWPIEVAEEETPPANDETLEVNAEEASTSEYGLVEVDAREVPAATESPIQSPVLIDILAEEMLTITESTPPEEDIAKEVMDSLVEAVVAVEEISTETAVPLTQEAVRSGGK